MTHDPLWGSVVVVQDILHCDHVKDVSGAILSLDGLEQGAHLGRRVSGRHCRLMDRDEKSLIVLWKWSKVFGLRQTQVP